MPAETLQKRQWLARTFAPYILVGGSETAKREVAFLTGMSLACLFQPFNGEVAHRIRSRFKSSGNRTPRSPDTSEDCSNSFCLSDDDEAYSPDQLDQASADVFGASKVPPLSLQLRVESSLSSGSSSTKSSSGAGGSQKRRSRSFCVRFMNLEEAEAVSCLSVESLAARSLLLASPSVTELREQMHSGPPTGFVGVGGPHSSVTGVPLGAELPWFSEWRRVIFEGSRFSPHETLSQPVGLILIVSTRDADPVAALEELLQPSNMPQMCRQYILDPNPVRAVILLDVHMNAYAARMRSGAHGGPHQEKPLEPESGPGGLVDAAADGFGAFGECSSAADGQPSERASSRSKEIMERLCAVFPPANCHLLTLGRGCADARHLQLLPAVRRLYHESLSFCFHPSLSANLTPTLLTHPSPHHMHQASTETELPMQQVQQQRQREQQADAIVGSSEKLPVAARLTPTTSPANTPPKGVPPQHAHHQQLQQQRHESTCRKAFAAGCLGCSFCVGLAWQDLQWLGAFVRHFVAASVVPWAEQRIKQLDSSISSNRKGFRNQLRYLWRKPKAVAAATTSGAAAEAVAGLAAAAEEAGGAAEALLSAVGGALLGDSGRGLGSGTANGTTCDTVEGKAGGVGMPSSPSSANSGGYVLHAIEWQYRLLGDLSLFFGQTENALQSYRSCAADFKQDKRWVHLGGAYEMCGVALHAIGGPRREVESYIEQAYNAYVKASMGRLALRCVLLGHRLLMDGSSSSGSSSSSSSSFLQLPHVLHLPLMVGGGTRASDVSADVARRLIAANAELPSLDAAMWQQQPQLQQQQGTSSIQAQSQAIRSAMLLEQAAVCLEEAGPSHWRKRNFQLVMAGHTYYKAGYKRFALRCYLHVFEGYEAGGWHHVAQHLRFIMARQTFSLHLLEESIMHFLGLLNGIAMLHECRVLAGTGGSGLPHIPPERQSHYVREFMFVCRVLLERQRLAVQSGEAPGSKALLQGLPVPTDETPSIVTLKEELRVPILQLRDSLGLFRDRGPHSSVAISLCLLSVGVYLVGDAMLPEEGQGCVQAEIRHSTLENSVQLSYFRGGHSSVPSYETLARLISRDASVQSIQELRVQENFWDRLFSLRLQQLGNGSSKCAEGETSQHGGQFVSHPVYESLRRQTAVGLPVTVELRVVNPLDLRIEINNLRLFGSLNPSCASQRGGTTGGPYEASVSTTTRNVDFSVASVELEPTASATIRLTATPLSSGRLCLEGVVGELFGLVQVSQYFSLHGTKRMERRFDLRHCHLDMVCEDQSQEEDSGSSGEENYLLQQRLGMIRQLLTAPSGSQVKQQLSHLLRGLPLFYALNVEGFRMLHTGTPIQVCRWNSRNRMAETHRPDLRLEVDVATDAVFLACTFIGWPVPQSHRPSSLEQVDEPHQNTGGNKLAGETIVTHSTHRDTQGQPSCETGASLSSPGVVSISGSPNVPWMLAGEQRECFLLVKNAATTLALSDLTVAVYPRNIVSVTSASLISEEEATAAAKASFIRQQQSQSAAESTEGGGSFSGGRPLRVASFEPTCSSKRMLSGETSFPSSVHIFSLLATSNAASTAAAAGVDVVPATKEECSPCLVPPGMTACLRLSVRAACAGLHRIRFCLRGQPTQQQLPEGEASESGKGWRLQPVWRAVEALLGVAPSLELHVQPRLSWRDPGIILFLCRVRNISSHYLQVSGLYVRGLPSRLNRQQQHLGEGDEEAGDSASGSTFPRRQVTEGSDIPPAFLPLVPYRGTFKDRNDAMTTTGGSESRQQTLAPNDELLLLYAAEDGQKLKHLAAAAENQIQVSLRWVFCHNTEEGLAASVPLAASSDTSFSGEGSCKMRSGTVMPPYPTKLIDIRYIRSATSFGSFAKECRHASTIFLSVSSQGIPLELSVAPSPALFQRFIKWRHQEPCTCQIAFTVRNTSKSVHMKLWLRAEPHARELVQADNVPKASAVAAAAPMDAPHCLVNASVEWNSLGRREWNRGVEGEGIEPTMLSPLSVPVFVSCEDEGSCQRRKVVLPDYCYNSNVGTRLGERIVECDSPEVSDVMIPVRKNGAPSRSQRPLQSSIGEASELLLTETDVEALQQTRVLGMDVAQRDKPVDAPSSPRTEQQQPKSTASHAYFARETQQRTSPDVCALDSVELQNEAPMATSDGGCLWLGKVAHDVGVLPPGGSARAEFTALFPSPGVYNLNTVKAQVELVADDVVCDGVNRREFGGPTRRLGLQRQCRGTATISTAQLMRSGWPSSKAAANVTFPFDFLVYVVPGDPP